jgi:FKBP-type peptidyl-prolyl cis-trans isomerase
VRVTPSWSIIRATMKQHPFAFSLAVALTGLAACQSGEKAPEKEAVVVVGKSTASATGGAAPGGSGTAMAEPVKPAGIPAPADVAAPPADAVKEKSGLSTKVIKAGTGKDKPRSFDTVKVHYSGWTKDGKMFDSSVARGAPTEFGVGDVIKGWTEGLQLMVVGETRRFWIPAALAYGDTPRMGAPSGDLTFDVELLEIQKGAEPPPVPEDLAKPGADAKKTKSGLAYRYLAHGKSKVHPKETDKVSVHYSGWTKDGKMFDSSVMRGKPMSFPLNRVIKGWTEGVQLMVPGDKVRFWIPGELAYGEKPARPGAPSGELVFDVELLEIQ